MRGVLIMGIFLKRRPGFHCDINTSKRVAVMTEDSHNTSMSTKASAKWKIALFLVSHLLNTAKQDGGIMLMPTAARSYLT